MTIPEGYQVMPAMRRRHTPTVSINPKWRQVYLNTAAYRAMGEPARVDAFWNGGEYLLIIPNVNGRFSMSARTLFFTRDEWERFGIPDDEKYWADFEFVEVDSGVTIDDVAIRIRLQNAEEAAS